MALGETRGRPPKPGRWIYHALSGLENRKEVELSDPGRWPISANLRQNPCAGGPLPLIRTKIGKPDLDFHLPRSGLRGIERLRFHKYIVKVQSAAKRAQRNPVLSVCGSSPIDNEKLNSGKARLIHLHPEVA